MPLRPSVLVLVLALGASMSMPRALGHQQGWTQAPAQEAPAPKPSGPGQSLAHLDEVDWSGWTELSDLLLDIHRRTGVPALAAAFVQDGAIVAQATVGVTAFGSLEAVAPDARFHLGSVTKSFSACVIGRLVEQGALAWDTRVDAVLEDVEMQDAYRAVTVEQLLQHRGGLPAYTDRRPAGHDPEKSYSGTPTEQRAAFLADVLRQAPVGTAGRTVLYSNAGYALVGHMAERATGESWEQLVQRLVLDPLGMQHSGFGFPEQPLGHAGNGPEFQPVPLEAYPRMAIIAPAGDLHASVGDLARYANAHLTGLGGQDGFLRATTVRRLHTVLGGSGAGTYASGWIVGTTASGEPLHHHGGTVGASYAEVQLYPARRSGTVVLTTVGVGLGEALASRIGDALRRRHGPEPVGFVRAKASSASDLEIVEGKATTAEDIRLWRLLRKMSTAINDEDRAAYRALFASTYERADADSMFDFMARNVLPARGGLFAFHEPGPPLKTAGSERPLRIVTFHLENGFPGYFGFRLDEADAIVEFSLFVKGDLCPSGTDRHCAKIVKTLAELE